MTHKEQLQINEALINHALKYCTMSFRLKPIINEKIVVECLFLFLFLKVLNKIPIQAPQQNTFFGLSWPDKCALNGGTKHTSSVEKTFFACFLRERE